MKEYIPSDLGLDSPAKIYANLNPPQLVEAAVRRGEGKLSNTGASYFGWKKRKKKKFDKSLYQ